jgi:deoxyribodipyrimidine photo-lyase
MSALQTEWRQATSNSKGFMNDTPLQREFADRSALIAYIQATFADVVETDTHVAAPLGGRTQALALLARIDPARYARSRNYLDGAVTHLSAYIRHGMLSLAEVRDVVMRYPDHAKLINELAWRDYWQRVYAQIGDGIWYDREPYKTGWQATDYGDTLPDDVAQGTTGLACMDAFTETLVTTGYLHNHARMWLAAYLIHWRRVAWQVGAAWFLQHLLDGDPASNNLSWQWVASTFSQKPYYFSQESLERYSGGQYCGVCTAQCPFHGSYDMLAARLFPHMTS